MANREEWETSRSADKNDIIDAAAGEGAAVVPPRRKDAEEVVVQRVEDLEAVFRRVQGEKKRKDGEVSLDEAGRASQREGGDPKDAAASEQLGSELQASKSTLDRGGSKSSLDRVGELESRSLLGDRSHRWVRRPREEDSNSASTNWKKVRIAVGRDSQSYQGFENSTSKRPTNGRDPLLSKLGNEGSIFRDILKEADLEMKIAHEDNLEDHKRDIYKWLKVTCKFPNIRLKVRAKLISILKDVGVFSLISETHHE